MKIQPATLQDIPTVLDLGEVMVAESRFRRYGLNRTKAASTLTAMINRPEHAIVLLACNSAGKPVGMLAGYVVDLFFCDAIVAQDRFFFVLPEARGSAAAIKLMVAFRRWGEQRGIDELNINMSVAVDMERFNKMMGKMGFVCCGSNFTLALGNKRPGQP